MATEAARLERKESTERKREKREKTLDSHRPSHGRHKLTENLGVPFAEPFHISFDFILHRSCHALNPVRAREYDRTKERPGDHQQIQSGASVKRPLHEHQHQEAFSQPQG